jgi:hypothetical protein
MFNLPVIPRATAVAAATFVLSLSASAPATAGPAVVSDPPYPAAGCTVGTLSTYQGTGSQGCTVGPLTFFNFSSAFEYIDGTQTALDPSSLIGVAPGANSSLRFNSALFDRTGQSAADYYFEYYIDPPIDIIGFRLQDAPFLNSYVEASVCVGATFNNSFEGGEVPSFGGGEGAPTFTGGEGAFTPADSCSSSSPLPRFAAVSPLAAAAAVDPQYYYFNINDTTSDDIQAFTQPDQFADVLLHVHIGADGHIDDFGTGAAIAAVPEPAEGALAAIGGLALAAGLRRKRQKR